MAEDGPRWQRLEHDERRAQILAAAKGLFAERPYSAVSTTDIAQAAGVARGLLNHYFGTKRDLYLEAVRDLVRMPVLPPIDLEGVAPEEAWERGVDLWLDVISADREMWLVAIGAGETGRQSGVQAILDDARELTSDRVLEALGIDPATAPGEVRATVRAFGAMAEEVSREWLARGRLSRAQAKAMLVGSLPVILEQVLPAVLDARGAGPGRGRRAAGSGV